MRCIAETGDNLELLIYLMGLSYQPIRSMDDFDISLCLETRQHLRDCSLCMGIYEETLGEISSDPAYAESVGPQNLKYLRENEAEVDKMLDDWREAQKRGIK
jgi:hypothetical protein